MQMRTIRPGVSASQMTHATLDEINSLVIGKNTHAALSGEDASARRQCIVPTQFRMPDKLVRERQSAFNGAELGRNRLRDLTVDKPPPRL